MSNKEVANIILNLSSGLLPENLSQDEILLLEKEFGVDWFGVLGYTEPEYKHPLSMKAIDDIPLDVEEWLIGCNF